MSKRAKKLSSEDKKLWHNVTKTVAAYHKHSDHNQFDINDVDYIDSEKYTVLSKTKVRKPSARAEADPYQPPAPRPKTSHAQLNPIEKPVHRKISKGRVPIDARIDLHGMTQQIAHRALLNFLTQAHTRGDRHVLVITGKGTSSGGQGILKQVVPEWFKNRDFNEIVSGYRLSARHHGGEGALYVRLRRKDGSR